MSHTNIQIKIPGTIYRLLSFDAALKQDGLNPGTSADLCVATIFALMLDQGCRNKITVLL